MPYRHDLVQISEPKIDQNGYLIADAFPTRAGVFKYVKPDGSITSELRHEDDVFKPESLNSLKHRPVVDQHPSVGALDAGNTSRLAVGHVGESVERSGEHVKANVIVTDERLIAKMMGKGDRPAQRELSCGYSCDVEETSGTYKGQTYDRRQTNIVYNHLASVQNGRAGPTAQIHLDAEDAVSDIFELRTPEPAKPATPHGDPPMTIKRKLQAVTMGKQDTETAYRADAMDIAFDEKAEPVVTQLTDQLDKANAHMELMQEKLDAVHGAKSKAEGERDQLEDDKKKKQKDHAEIDKMADVRADLKGVAAHLGVKDYADKSNVEIMGLVVAHRNPDLKLDDLSEGNIEGRFGAICDGIKQEHKGLESLAALKSATGPATREDVDPSKTQPSPRVGMIEDVQDMHGKTEAEVKKDWADKKKARLAAANAA